MTREEARNILLLHRPWVDEPQDLPMREALQRTELDAELAAWFAGHGTRQAAIQAALREIRPPSALKEQILSERPRPAATRSWRKPVQLILAGAAVALLVFIGLEWKQHRAVQLELSFDSYRGRMVSDALRIYSMDLETNNPTVIRAYLGQQQAHANYHLPKALAEATATGCGVLSWQGHRVSMLCFNSGRALRPGQKTDLFLFVMNHGAAGNAPKNTLPRIEPVNRMITASWTEGDLTYVLATEGDEGFLRKYL